MKRPHVILLSLLVAPLAAPSADLEVLRMNSLQRPAFSCGERCKFETDQTPFPVRFRIVRGSQSELSGLSMKAMAVPDGCLEVPYLAVTPRRWHEILDLRFYFDRGWLAVDGNRIRDGRYVFVAERAPANSPSFEAGTLRLAADAATGYFESGVEVIIRTPAELARPVAKKKMAARAGGPPDAATAGAEPVESVAETGRVPVTSANNCVGVRFFDLTTVTLRQAEAKRDRGEPGFASGGQ